MFFNLYKNRIRYYYYYHYYCYSHFTGEKTEAERSDNMSKAIYNYEAAKPD